MAQLSKSEKDAAYDAGFALPRVQWPDDATDDQRRLGEHHSPFAPDDPQHTEWLRGLRDAMEQSLPDPTEHRAILKRIDDQLEVDSHAE